MNKKTSYAVFSLTDSGKEYLVRGNFGDEQTSANQWAENHINDRYIGPDGESLNEHHKYPNGFVKKIQY